MGVILFLKLNLLVSNLCPCGLLNKVSHTRIHHLHECPRIQPDAQDQEYKMALVFRKARSARFEFGKTPSSQTSFKFGDAS